LESVKGVTQAPQPQQGALRLWEATISGAGAHCLDGPCTI